MSNTEGHQPEPEPRLLRAYLNDHLAGSVAGTQRFARMADVLRSTPVGPSVERVAREVAEEQEALRSIVDSIDATGENPVKQVLVQVGERVARLKAVRAQLRRRPLDTLLEVELLRAALVGKLGVWETLRDLAPAAGIDRGRCEELRSRTVEQISTLHEVHAYVRMRALSG